MEDRGPFTMEGGKIEETILHAKVLLAASKEAAAEQLAGKPLWQDKGLPKDATVFGRTVASIALQSIIQNREDAGISPFDLIDGMAHAIAGWLAQGSPEAAKSGMMVLFGNVQGYEMRTRAALAQKGPLNG